MEGEEKKKQNPQNPNNKIKTKKKKPPQNRDSYKFRNQRKAILYNLYFAISQLK